MVAVVPKERQEWRDETTGANDSQLLSAGAAMSSSPSGFTGFLAGGFQRLITPICSAGFTNSGNNPLLSALLPLQSFLAAPICFVIEWQLATKAANRIGEPSGQTHSQIA